MDRVLTQLRVKYRKVEPDKRGFRVLHESETDRETFLAMTGVRVGGGTWKIARTQIRMTPEQIFRFVADRLQCVEEANERKRILDGRHGESDSETVRTVEVTPISPRKKDKEVPEKKQEEKKEVALPEKKSEVKPDESSSSQPPYNAMRGPINPSQNHGNWGQHKGKGKGYANQPAQWNWGNQGNYEQRQPAYDQRKGGGHYQNDGKNAYNPGKGNYSDKSGAQKGESYSQNKGAGNKGKGKGEKGHAQYRGGNQAVYGRGGGKGESSHPPRPRENVQNPPGPNDR